MTVTMRDVAQRAGVFIKTVSPVASAKTDITETTCQCVIAAINELGYQSNATARSLVSRRTHVLGVLTTGLSNYTHTHHRGSGDRMMFVGAAQYSRDSEPLRSLLFSQHRFEGLLVVYHGNHPITHKIFNYISPNLSISYTTNHKNITTTYRSSGPLASQGSDSQFMRSTGSNRAAGLNQMSCRTG